MIDYHIHTHHSIDAEGTMAEYCSQAVKLGLQEICFTNHCELDALRNDSFIKFNNNREPFTRQGLQKLQSEALRQKELYRHSGLDVKFGLEVGYYDGIEPHVRKILDGIEFDYLLGSVHCLDHICIDSSKECTAYFTKHTAKELLQEYFETIEKLINSQLFDSIAHLDVYKKYGIGYYNEEINDPGEDLIRKTFRVMAERKIALEVNTAGLRRINEFYPSPFIMKHARKQGIELITIGSDAHKIQDLGKGIKQGIQYLKSFGFDAVYGFEKRKPIRIKI